MSELRTIESCLSSIPIKNPIYATCRSFGHHSKFMTIAIIVQIWLYVLITTTREYNLKVPKLLYLLQICSVNMQTTLSRSFCNADFYLSLYFGGKFYLVHAGGLTLKSSTLLYHLQKQMSYPAVLNCHDTLYSCNTINSCYTPQRKSKVFFIVPHVIAKQVRIPLRLQCPVSICILKLAEVRVWLKFMLNLSF